MMLQLDKQVPKKEKVYMVIKTVSENTDFWDNVLDGAEVAATELGVEVIVDGPEREIYVEDQIAIMQSFVDLKPKTIAIAASDYKALSAVCNAAMDAGITLVTFDSDAEINQPHSFVATNSREAAQRLAHELATLIDGKGQLAIVSHVEGAFTTFEREDGFKKGLNPYPEIEVVSEGNYSDNYEEVAYEMTEGLVEKYPDLKAIYATNEGSLLGVGKAIRDLGLQNKITVVGFDMNSEIALMIEEDVIDAAMVQRPFNIGYLAVKEAIEVSKGKEPEVIDTGAVMINKANMFLPENQKLIVPSVD
jgi:ribose transport system substrate-binding protein